MNCQQFVRALYDYFRFFCQLRVYAQLFPNGREAQVVIPPAYIGRRVRSNPPSPSYTQCFSRTVQQISELRDMEEMQQRRPEYDPIFVS